MRVVIFLILIFIIGPSGNNGFCNEIKLPHLYVFHINGVNTSLAEANRNRDVLKNTAYITSNIITWDVLYNSTHGLLASDLADVLRQKKQENKDLTIDDYVMTYMQAYNLNYPYGSPQYEQLKSEIKTDYMTDPSFVGMNLAEIIDQFHADVPMENGNDYRNTKDAYVLLVPHSQGNLYANQLWDYLVNAEHFPSEHLAVFGIGNAANQLNGIVQPAQFEPPRSDLPNDKLTYVTADNDFVINSLSIFSDFIPGTDAPMPSNMHLITCKDILCHSLIDAYLTDQTVKARILMQLNLFIIALKNKLIEENMGGSIRMLMHASAMIDKNTQLINNVGTILCDFGECDQNAFGFVTNHIYINYDKYSDQFYGFSNKVLPIEHFLLLRSNGLTTSNVSAYIHGNILSAIYYSSDGLCLRPDFDTYQSAHIQTNPDDILYGRPAASLYGSTLLNCAAVYPQLYFNGLYIAGRFILF